MPHASANLLRGSLYHSRTKSIAGTNSLALHFVRMAATTASPSLDETEEHGSPENLQAQASVELDSAERELEEIKRQLQELPGMTRDPRAPRPQARSSN